MDLQLVNKTAFVSGSTAGIGYAIAEGLLREGAAVIINGRTKDSTDAAVKTLKQTISNAKVSGLSADFGNGDEVRALIAQLPEIDILINNVGIFEPKAFADITDEEWLKFFDVNVMSGVRLSRAVFNKMINKNWGRIIFISSESGVFIPEEMIHYGTTKTAQLGVSRGLAELTKGTGVTVNTVLPGPTKSRGVGQFITQLAEKDNKTEAEVEQVFFKDFRPTSLIKRFASVEEVANMVVYLSSPLSSATNGAAVRVEGGLLKGAF